MSRNRAARVALGRGPAASGAMAVAFAATVLASPAPAAAQSQWDVLLHGSGLSYQDSQVKDGGSVVGFYGTYGTGYKHLVEVGATRTGIDYLDGWRLSQTDLALAYSRFGANGAGRVGAHLVSSTDPLTDGGTILFAGASRYRVGVWSAGAEAAWSSYGEYGGGLSVVQVAPSAGFTAYAEGGHILGATLKGYVIHLSEDTGLGDTDFLSAEAAVSYTSGSVTVSGFAWAGEQAFAVRSGGFLAFNLSELHTGGYGGGLRWVMTPKAALSAGLYVERFQDAEVPVDAWARTLSVSLGFTL